jgi:3-methyl-2-oxobutanoate hydroxymethyltransferase
MVRPRKKYTVHDLRKLKGKRVLTHIHVKSPQEATAAEAAGIDLMSCSFDSPEAQARLPLLVAAAPTAFLSGSTPHGMATQEEAIRTGFRALEMGASSVYCSGSPFFIEAMAREGIPVVGHIGMVPRHVTWTGYRSLGKTVDGGEGHLPKDEGPRKRRCVCCGDRDRAAQPRLVALPSRRRMLLMSLGSGTGCDTQFLFS